MVRSQLSPEFVVSALLFLSMMIMVFSSFLRTYFLYTGDYQLENTYMTSEKYLNLLVSKSGMGEWTQEPFNTTTFSLTTNKMLDFDKVKLFGAFPYPHAKNLLDAHKDFNVRVRYLPSLVISPSYSSSYPLGNITMGAQVRDLEGQLVNSTLYAVLIPPSGNTTVIEKTPFFGQYSFMFTVNETGNYRVELVAFSDIQYGLTEFEVGIS